MALPDEVKAAHVPPHWMMYIGVDSLEDGRRPRPAAGRLDPVPGHRHPRRRTDAGAEGRRRARLRHLPALVAAAGARRRPAVRATSRGTSSTPPTTPRRWPSTASCSDGSRPRRWTWGRWASTACSAAAARPVDGRHDDQDAGHGADPQLLAARTSACRTSHSAAERVKANGGTVMMGPMEVPGGSWILQGQDPQGGTSRCTTQAEAAPSIEMALKIEDCSSDWRNCALRGCAIE